MTGLRRLIQRFHGIEVEGPVAALWNRWDVDRAGKQVGEANRDHARGIEYTVPTSMDDFSIPFLESDANDDPFAQFQDWFDDVLRLDLPEPNAVVLATASAEGVPAARVVLLKGVDKEGFLFFTNYQSAKGRDLKANPAASLCFHWQDLRRQVRVQGTIKKAPRKVSESYFRSRPRGSQIGAWASPQSQEVPDRAALDKRIVETEQRFASGDVSCPPHWGGYLLKPETIEFWRHGGDRMHDRIVYRLAGRAWAKHRIAP